MKAITSRLVFNGNELLTDKAVIVNGNYIEGLVTADSIPDGVELVNLGNGIIAPGFVDLQLNGCGGKLFNHDISIDTLETMYIVSRRFATTSFLPTLISAPFADIIKSLDTVRLWIDRHGFSRGVIGIHLEGPFISKEKCGIHNTEYICAPEIEHLRQIARYHKYFPIKMTIAPEVFTIEQLDYLTAHGIILAMGHTNCDYEEAMFALTHGVKTATHVFNAMSGLTSRNPGAIGAVLNSDVYAGLINDLIHVSPGNVEILHKLKADKTYLVTDAVTPMGTDMKDFELMGKCLKVINGKCVDENGVIGGANISMIDAVNNCVNSCNLHLSDTLKMASTIPAELMGYGDKLGKIQSGHLAQLVYLDFNQEIYQVIE